jgi:hypothetical protein
MYDERSRFRSFELSAPEEWIDLAGAERTILASDLGQADNPLPPDSLERVGLELAENEVGEPVVRDLLATNPARLLGLDGSGEP